METEKERLERLWQVVLRQAKALHIPYAASIDPAIRVNRRAVRRLGCCVKKGGHFEIEVSAALMDAADDAICQVLAHELLHTCYGCQNHGKRWKGYANRMNSVYGYSIQRTDDPTKWGVVQEHSLPRYRVFCKTCGKEWFRYSKSALVEHPERYRCSCGGLLESVPCISKEQ